MKMGRNTMKLAPNLIVGEAMSGIVELLKLNNPNAMVGLLGRYRSGV